MPSINIALESRVSLAFIVLEHIDYVLIDIRKKIREEVDELVPKEFRFISIWGPPISEVQEAKMSVGDALHEGKTLVIRSYDEKLNEKRKAGEIEEGSEANKCAATSTKTSQEAKQLPESKRPVQKTMSKYFSIPSSAKTSNILEKSAMSFSANVNDHEQKSEQNKTVKKGDTPPFPNRKIVLFTDDEISNQPSWLERERRKHWNLKLHELNNSKQCTTYDNQELLGIIDTDWTFRKARLLQIRTDELQVMQDSLETVYHDQHPLTPPKTISGNYEEISKLLVYIENENSKLSSVTSESIRDQTEERLHNYLYDLKRSSDALFKALNSWEANLRKFKAKQLEKEPSDSAVLSLEEENEIASNIFSE